MATIAKLDVLLGLKGDGFDKGIDAARGKLDSWGASARATGAKLTAGVTAPIALMGWQALQASSSLDQAQGKVDAVFGESSAVIKDWSTTTTNAFGISQTAALQSAGTMGNFFTSANIATEQSAQYSMQLVELSGDMAAFNDVSASRATEAIISGMAGEYDSLQRLGVNITAAKVEQEAMNIATADGRDTITEADLALARYNVIMEESKNQHGQAAREYDNFSSKLARMQARLSDLAAKWGNVLMPVALDFLGLIEDLLGWVENLSPAMQRWVIIIAAAAAALGPLLIVLGMMLPGLSLLLGLVAALLSPFGLLVAAAALLAYTFRDELGAALDWVMDKVSEFTEIWSSLRDRGLDPVQAALAALQQMFPALGAVIAPVRQLVENLGDAFEAIRRGDYASAMSSIGAALRNIGSAAKALLDLAWRAVQDGIALAWDQITSLTWADFVPLLVWGVYLADLLWDDYIMPFLWSTFVKTLVWADYLSELPWGDYLDTLLWATYVTLLSWGDYLAPILWSEFVDPLLWATYVTLLSWADYLVVLAWDTFVDLLSWDTFLDVLSWVTFISPVGWADYIPLISWSNYINPIWWGTYIFRLIWNDYVSSLVWDFFLDMLTWDNFVDLLEWSAFVVSLSWGTYLVSLAWSTFVPSVSWSDFIPSLEWPSKGDILNAIIGAIGGNQQLPTEPVIEEGGWKDTQDPATAGQGWDNFSQGNLFDVSGLGSRLGAAIAAEIDIAKPIVSAALASVQTDTIVPQTAAWVGAMATGLAPIGSTASVSFGTVNTSAATQLGMASASVAMNTGAMNATSTANLGAMAANGVSQVAGMAASVTSGLSGMRGSAVSTVASMGSSVGSSMTSMSTTSAAQVLGMRMGIAASMLSMQSSATSAANSTRSGVVSAFTSMALQSASAVSSGMSAIPGIIASVGGSAAATAQSVGYMIGAGVAAGLYAALGEVQAAASAIVNAAAGAMAAAALVRSPSKRFRDEIGRQIGAGVALGIRDGEHDVTSASRELIDGISTDVGNVMASIGPSGGTGGDGEDCRRPIVQIITLEPGRWKEFLANAEAGGEFARNFSGELGMKGGQV